MFANKKNKKQNEIKKLGDGGAIDRGGYCPRGLLSGGYCHKIHKILLITLRHINVLHEDITYIQCYMAK